MEFEELFFILNKYNINGQDMFILSDRENCYKYEDHLVYFTGKGDTWIWGDGPGNFTKILRNFI